MSASLFECSSCHRHVRASERACPFCLSVLPPSFGRGPRVPAPPAGLSRAERAKYTDRARASVFAGSVAVATALSACGGSTFDFADGSAPPSCSGNTFLVVPASDCGLTCVSPEPCDPVALYGGCPGGSENVAYLMCQGQSFTACSCTYPGAGWKSACPHGQGAGLTCEPADAGEESSGDDACSSETVDAEPGDARHE